MSLVPGQLFTPNPAPAVQIGALQKAIGNGGLTLNPGSPPLRTPGEQKAADILKNPGPMTPIPSGGSYPVSSSGGGGFSNGGYSNQANALSAYQSSGGSYGGGGSPAPTAPPPPPFGSAQRPAGSDTQANAPASNYTNTPTGQRGVTSVTSATGDKANALNTNPQAVLSDAQTKRDAQNAALQAQLDTVTNNVYSSDRQKQDALAAYQTAVSQNNQKSPEEMEAQAQLDNLEGSQSISSAELANQPISIGFITGQQAALEKRVSALKQPLSSKLARLQGARQSKQQAALDVAKLNYDSANEASRTARSEQQNARTRFDTFQDQGVTRAETLQDKNNANSTFTLNPGDQRYVNGQLVASAPKAATTPTKTPVQYTEVRSLPEKIRNDVLDDVVLNKGTLDQLYQAYPEISKEAVKQLYEQFSLQGKNLSNPTSGRTI